MSCRGVAVTLALAIACLAAPLSSPARAGSSVRYALIVGNDHGATDELKLEDLHRAEAEARSLQQRLVSFGNFDESRVALVAGGDREEILAAARRLAARHRRDRAQLGELPTLFIFAFSGHGLSGKLLTRGEPLTGDDLAAIYKEMDATLSVGLFDACFSESLALQGKGAIATPGFNPLTELPEEVLNAEGTVWFVSSRPDEQSYEDREIGSLFTYYFLESFTEAQPDGVAITLDEMWEYTRRRTSAHAARYGRAQNPVKIVRHLKSRGPLYFSFPSERRARVRFTPEVEGEFLIQYQHGALVERVSKPAGQPLEVALYEGEVLLSRLQPGQTERAPSQRLTLAPGSEVTVRPSDTPAPLRGPGYGEASIRSKGGLTELEVSEQRWRASLDLGLAYGLGVTRPELLAGLHRLELGAAFAHGPINLDLDLSYGYNTGDFTTWSYQLHEVGLRAMAGYGLRLGTLRLDLQLGGAPLLGFVGYASGRERQQLALWLGGAARLRWALPFFPWLALNARLSAGALRAQGLALRDEQAYWSPSAGLTLGLSVPVLGP